MLDVAAYIFNPSTGFRVVVARATQWDLSQQNKTASLNKNKKIYPVSLFTLPSSWLNQGQACLRQWHA